MLVFIPENAPRFSLSMVIGKGSHSHCFAGEYEIIEDISPLKTGIKLCTLCSILYCDSM